MGDCFAALAEGYLEGAWINSLGKAGLHKNGSRKSNGCTTLESAKQRAINAVLNRLRSRRFGRNGMLERKIFEERDPQLYNRLVNEIVENVEWTYHLPTDSYKTKFDVDDFAAGVIA